MKKKLVHIAIHIAAWACFMVIPVAITPRPREVSVLTEAPYLRFFILSYLLVICFYYLNYYLLVPKLLANKKVWLYGSVILVLLLLFSMFPRFYYVVNPDFQHFLLSLRRTTDIATRPPRTPLLITPSSLALFLLVFAVSTGIYVVTQWFNSEKRNKEIENEKLQTELSFLKAQINPHFLFNTLNNIYALAADRSEHTAEAVMKLSNIMRYVLTDARHDYVALEKEILFVRHYIELQKMRVTDKTSVEFCVKGDPTGKQISPLLFLPFIENAFKYGISTRENSPIGVNLVIGEKMLEFTVRNNKQSYATLKPTENTGIGIQNTKRRLQLLYASRHSLRIEDEKSNFTVHLKIEC